MKLDMELGKAEVSTDIHKIRNYKPSMKGKYVWVKGESYQEIGVIVDKMTYNCLYRKYKTSWKRFTFNRKFINDERAYIISEEEMYGILF